MPSEAIEDYLKKIYVAQQDHDTVSTCLLARLMDVSPASTTAMLKKLAEQNLVTYEPYKGVNLTPAGQKIALEVIRHHRLVELYLQEALGVPWDRVHEEAEKWEHVLSEDLEDRIDKALGHPEFDPHGAPIPSRCGTINGRAKTPLIDLPVGQSSRVVEVSDDDPDLLRYLTELGIQLNTKLEVVAIAPFDGPVSLRVDDTEHSIGRLVASHIFVADD